MNQKRSGANMSGNSNPLYKLIQRHHNKATKGNLALLLAEAFSLRKANRENEGILPEHLRLEGQQCFEQTMQAIFGGAYGQ